MNYFALWRHRLRNLTVLETVRRRDRNCQFWGHIWDRWPGQPTLVGTPTICQGVGIVINTRPDLPLDDINCTLICERHWHWLEQHIDIAASIGIAHTIGDTE